MKSSIPTPPLALVWPPQRVSSCVCLLFDARRARWWKLTLTKTKELNEAEKCDCVFDEQSADLVFVWLRLGGSAELWRPRSRRVTGTTPVWRRFHWNKVLMLGILVSARLAVLLKLNLFSSTSESSRSFVRNQRPETSVKLLKPSLSSNIPIIS